MEHQFGGGAAVEVLHQAGLVGADGFVADAEAFGDVLYSASSHRLRHRTSRPVDFKLSTDGVDGALLDFPVAWNRGHFSGVEILPQSVVAALADHQATVCRQMPLQLAQLHGAANSKVSRIVEDSWRGLFRDCSR